MEKKVPKNAKPAPEDNPFRNYVPDDTFRDITPPPTDGEYRPRSIPPSPAHSSEGETADSRAAKSLRCQKLRNQEVQKYLRLLEEKGVKKPVPETLYDKRTPSVGRKSTRKQRGGNSNADGSPEVTRNVYTRLGATLDDLMEVEKVQLEERQKDMIPHDYTKHGMIVGAKWLIFRMERMEKLLSGETDKVVISKKYLHFAEEMEDIYGPLDKDSEIYEKMLDAFTEKRDEKVVAMMQAEEEILGLRNKSVELATLASESVEPEILEMVNSIKTARIKLEEAFNELLDPFTSYFTLGLEFYALPRPPRTVDVYKLRSTEFKHLKEYEKSFTQSVPYFYNPALFDVAWDCFPTFVDPDLDRDCYFKVPGTTMPLLPELEKWDSHLLALRALMTEYRFGVAATVFAKEFRERKKLSPTDSIFGRLSDDDGISKLPDIFFVQTLGNDQRAILFHGIFKGVIVTPEEMLRRFWKRIRSVVKIMKIVKLCELESKYEHIHGQKLAIIFSWGFGSTTEFVLYSIENIPDEFEDMEMVGRDEEPDTKVLRLKKLERGTE